MIIWEHEDAGAAAKIVPLDEETKARLRRAISRAHCIGYDLDGFLGIRFLGWDVDDVDREFYLDSIGGE
jgi:hypothetical protein